MQCDMYVLIVFANPSALALSRRFRSRRPSKLNVVGTSYCRIFPLCAGLVLGVASYSSKVLRSIRPSELLQVRFDALNDSKPTKVLKGRSSDDLSRLEPVSQTKFSVSLQLIGEKVHQVSIIGVNHTRGKSRTEFQQLICLVI